MDKPPAPAPAASMDANVIAGLLHMGVSQADIDAEIERRREHQAEQAEQQGSAVYEVHADAWESWLLFLKVQTQWHYSTQGYAVRGGLILSGVRCGLHRSCVESVVRMGGYPRRDWPGLLADLEVIEEAVLEADAQLRSAD